MMSLSPLSRNFHCFGIPIILSLAILMLVFLIPKSPVSPFHMCTLIGCKDSLEIVLSHQPPDEYLVQVTSDTGEMRSISCSPGKEEVHTSDTYNAPTLCRTAAVTFFDFTPREVTIKITWQGGSTITSGRPNYESFRPNGRFCPPECQVGRMLVAIP